MTKVFTDLTTWQAFRTEHQTLTLGFVPTMGALHEGHLSLVRKSQRENDATLVSIFVNPTQFNDPHDFQNYPHTLSADFAQLEGLDVDFLLSPSFEQLYPDDYAYKVMETQLSTHLCGAFRQGHFGGMLTVVIKLLNLAQAHQAYFGEKDYQQFQLIEGMAKAFFLTTKIISCPTVREPDGLALSSRNALLTPQERKIAPLFFSTLTTASHPAQARATLENHGFEVEYVEDKQGRRFGAVKLGHVRLIDNIAI